MKTINVTLRGIRPLIMSNPQTVDVENAFSGEQRRLNRLLKDARKKGDEDRLLDLAVQQKKTDFMAGAYFDDKAKKFFIPDAVIMACIKEAAKASKKGKDIDRAVLMEETHAYVENVPTVKSLEDAYTKADFKLQTPCKIPPKTGSLFMKLRCVMPTGWKTKFALSFDEEVIAEKTIHEVLARAGGFVGIGSWRPKFGRFVVEAK